MGGNQKNDKRIMEVKRQIKLLEKSHESIKKITKWMTSHGKSSEVSILEVQLQQLEFFYKTCFEYNSCLWDIMEEEDEITYSDAYENDYVNTKAGLLDLISVKKPDHKPATVMEQSMVVASKSIKLPKLQLPQFSGHYSEWLDFKNEFTALVIDDTDLNDVERFRFLKSCLVGSARRTISQMETSKDNFKSTWKALTTRYENKALMFQTHINDILSMKSIAKESATGLREMLDRVSSHYRALASLGSKDELAENLLICLMLSKMDVVTAMKWEESTTKDIPTWDGFTDFLEKRASILEKIDCNIKQMTKNSNASTPKSKNPGSHSVFVSSKEEKCTACGANDHIITSCKVFLGKSALERYRVMNKKRICVLCLSGKHGARGCKAGFCERCKRRHHTLLHFEVESGASTSGDITGSAQNVLIASNVHNDVPAILATALVNVYDNGGCLVPCRALLDSCASTNFITERFVQTLGLERQKLFCSIGGIGSSSTSSKASCEITLVSRLSCDDKFVINASILSKISEAQPSSLLSINALGIPSNIPLADPKFYQPQAIDMLLGAGIFWSLMAPERILLGENLPVVQNTKLGWIIGGPCNEIRASRNTAFLSILEETRLNDMEKAVQTFWEMEAFPNDSKLLNTKDKECERHFDANTRRDTDGSYIVCLPFSKPPSSLGQSQAIATRRFLNLEKRLNRNVDMKKMYVDFITEYTEMKHLEVVEDFNPTQLHYFLPHHCVIKLSSSSTKLRVVFDGSCKTSSGTSLNEILHTGPKLQDDLFIILLKFRLFRFVLTGDIQKMYRQVKLDPSDRNFQLILWRSDVNEPLKILRLCTVTYDTACGSLKRFSN